MIIYLHGWNSAAISGKSRQLVAYCAKHGIECMALTMHHYPSVAIRQVEEIIKHTSPPHTLVGSSMGGFYTTWLCENHPNLKGVLINPALKLADKLASYEETLQDNYYTHEGYVFYSKHLEELREFEVAKISQPERYLLMVQTGDELLNYREAVAYYKGARHIVEKGGDHMFEGFENHLQTIVAFAADN